MQIEPIGLIALALGLLGWYLGTKFSIWVFVLANLFGAAGAIILTSFGSANIQPADLLLAFLAVPALVTRGMLREAGRALVFPRVGFWLALTATYVVFSALFLPRRTFCRSAARSAASNTTQPCLFQKSARYEAQDMAATRPGDFVLPGAKANRPLSNMSLLMILRRMASPGWRS